MDDDASEGKAHTTFERLGDLKKWQESLFSLDLFQEPTDEQLKTEAWAEQKFSSTLAEYQEQSYLLDPFLEELVTPVVEHLKSYARSVVANPSKVGSSIRVNRLSTLLYDYFKFRGYKTIIRFFPHEVADLTIVLDFAYVPSGPMEDPSQWALRYVILLWLHLICIIPFDLAQFDEPMHAGRTAESLENLAKRFLSRAGLERQGAALLLSRLYMRKDASYAFHGFVVWSEKVVKEGTDAMMVLGILHVLCEVAKSGSAEQVQSEVVRLMSLARILQENETLSMHTLIRKYWTKLKSRSAIRLLPATAITGRKNVRQLSGELLLDPGNHEVFDVPDEIDEIVEQLLGALQDKNTIVRWSAAKGIARIAERLPHDFAHQVLESILGLFDIHSAAAAAMYDLPAVAEGTWHGACLACAELARRNIIEAQYLPKLIDCLSKALCFDVRKGAHSIGSNVRDAAAYVVWALARTQNRATLVPHTEVLAQRLMAATLFDREVHIRRAASAAFQEHVGRTGLFPHGIDVLGKTDFYAVSIRKHAFLIAAPQVAQHVEYRRVLFGHLLDVVLRHWDMTMRELGAESLRLICAYEPDGLIPLAIEKLIRLLNSLDTADVHGSLSALSQIAIAYNDAIKDPTELEERLYNVCKLLGHISDISLTSTRNEIIIAGACHLVANSITLRELSQVEHLTTPKWKKIVEVGLKHRRVSVQEAAAAAMARISSLKDYSMTHGTPLVQQSLARLLGVVDWKINSAILSKGINYLLDRVQSSADVETRRCCFEAMPRILTVLSAELTSMLSNDVVNALLDALISGLTDYTTDERGDVGSWVRIACIQGLTDIVDLLFRVFLLGSNSINNDVELLQAYLPSEKFHVIVAGVLKQGMEKLDNVRQEAGLCVMKFLNMNLPDGAGLDQWRLHGVVLLRQLFQTEAHEWHGWNDAGWLFHRAMRLLEIPEYRKEILSGVVASIGSKTDSTRRPVSTSFVEFAQVLPIARSAETTYSLSELVSDLIDFAKSNVTSNTVIVPVFQAFVLLLEVDALRELIAECDGWKSIRTLLDMASRNVGKIRNIQRINESMKIVVNLLTLDEIKNKNGFLLFQFLTHPFPRVRADTAEYFYVMLQRTDAEFETEKLEEILLETEWSKEDISISETAAKSIIGILGPSS